MQKINLLYVVTKLELGGAQKQLLKLVIHLNKRSYNLFLITARDGLLVKDALSIEDLRFIRSRFLERSINPLRDLIALGQIYCFIKRNKIDIVHTHSSKAGILGRWAASFAGTKIIIHTIHGWSFNEYQNCLWRRIAVWMERITAFITDQLIVVSNSDLQKGLKNRIGNRDKYKLIRYGIDYKKFSRLDKNIRQDRSSNIATFDNKDKDLREELRINSSDLLVGMVSCFKPQKSPQDFIRLAYLVNKSLSRLHPCANWADKSLNKTIGTGVKFILIGDGILRKKIGRLISEFDLGQQVILTGWRKDIPHILSTIDIFVLTSLWEGLPISVLEAKASSLPVVATNTGGISEVLLEGRTGFLVSPGDVDKMAEKLIDLLKDKNLREQIGQNARNSLGCIFSLEDMVGDTDNSYRDLIKERLPEKNNTDTGIF